MSTLFVLDDDPIFYWITKLMNIKQRLFDKIFHYKDGNELIDYLSDNQNDHKQLPDAIFVDLDMPLLDGWQFLDAYRKLSGPFGKQISFYILSCSINEKDRRRAGTYDFVKEFISKPLTKDKLSAIFREVNQSSSMA